MKTIGWFLSVALVGTVNIARAEVQVWTGSAENAVWDLTSPNWDNGSVWTPGNTAVFGADGTKNITVGEDVEVGGLSFTADGYTLGGTGALVFSGENAATSTISVAEGGAATLTASITNGVGGTLVQEGGTLTFSGVNILEDMIVSNGTLRLVDGTNSVKMLNGTMDAHLLFDGVSLRSTASSGMESTMLGSLFADVQVGAKGVSFWSHTDRSLRASISSADGVEMDGGVSYESSVWHLYSGESTYKGGTYMRTSSAQARPRVSNAFGTGPIYLQGLAASSIFVAGNVEITNKIVFANTEAYIGATGGAGDIVTARNLAGTDAGGHGAYIGRSGGNFSRATLALDGTDNEPLKFIKVRGNLDFSLDGGTLRARSDALARYFQADNMNRAKTVAVSLKGITFDAAENCETEFGLTPVFAAPKVATNVLEEVFPANYSFEEKPDTGWTNGKTAEAPSNVTAPPGRLDTSMSNWLSDSNYFPTNGVAFYATRQCNWFETKNAVNLATAGKWRVRFETESRPGYNFFGDITVTIDAGIGAEQSYTFADQRNGSRFHLLETEPFELAAGPHKIRITTGKCTRQGGGVSDSQFFDVIRFARTEVVTNRTVFTKTGAGTLAVTNFVGDADVRVQGGTLALNGNVFDGQSYTVDAGSCLRVNAGTYANSPISVANGATFEFGRGANLIANGSFEQDVVTDGKTMTPSGWTIGMFNGQGEWPGVQRNGYNMSKASDGGPVTPFGEQTAFVRARNSLSQTVIAPVDGDYQLSFIYAPRHYGACQRLTLKVVTVHEDVTNVVYTFTPPTDADGYYDFKRVSETVTLAAGESYTFAFIVGEEQSYRYESLFIDDVSLVSTADSGFAFDNSVIDLSAGSTVKLSSAGMVVLNRGDVRVDGKIVTGSASTAFRAHGVNVEGSGTIQIGAPAGTVFLLR